MQWVKFEHDNTSGFGTLDGETITVYEGNLFGDNQATPNILSIESVKLLAPCQPSKIVALWNNFHALAEKQGNAIPESPLYFLKPASCVIGPGNDIVRPKGYAGRIMYEGELGIVIGKACYQVEQAEALDYVKGYTCVNDVTAFPIIDESKEFQQWTRAKSFDTFGALGPCIAEIEDPTVLNVTTRLNGRERQNYPVSDMIFSPAALVNQISQDMTLEPGDVIACGTSLGVLPMKKGATIEIIIDGIGTLKNQFTE